MKARTKVLLTSIASIAVSASIAVGGTYALFTDQATVNVAVTSGTVDVEATIVKDSLATYSRGIAQEQGFFANDPDSMPGATFDENDNLVLMNITPGDKVEFEIAVTNNSNVDIQYRTVVYLTGSLADYLVWTSSVSDWTYVEGDKDIANVEVSVEFPEEVTYDDLGGIAEYNATVAFTVEAIQGNGDTGFDYDGDEDVYKVSNVYGLYKFAESVNAGTSYADETILLTCDLDLANEAWTPIGVWNDAAFEGTFDGQGYTISNMKLDDETAFCVGLFGLTDGATIQNVNIENVDYNIDQQVGAVVGYAMGETTTITNCHVSGSVNLVANYAYAGGIVSDGYVNVSNCSVIADDMGVIKAVEKNVAGGIIAYLNDGVIDGCVAENLEVEGWTNVGAIAGFTLFGTTISNNSAKNVNLTKTRLGGNPGIGLAAGGWCYSATATTTIANNSFENVVVNALSKEYAVDNTIMFGSEYGGSTDSSCLVVSGNTMTNITDKRDIYMEFGYNATKGVYSIGSVQGLYAFAESVNAGTTYAGQTVQLLLDLDLNNQDWTPIGNLDAGKDFKGTFDGQGYTISNLKLHNEDMNGVALFGLANNATIKNVNVENVDLKGYSQVATILAKGTSSKVTNCHVSGNVSVVGVWAYVGGIMAYSYSTVSDCSVIADDRGVIESETRNGVGGIVAWQNEGSYVTDNCHVANLDIIGWTNVGGIAGFTHYGTTISNCSVKNVNLTKTRLGGNPAIGLACGGWELNANDASKKITITNNVFENITVTGESKEYAVDNTIMFGSSYGGSTDSSCLVVTNNTTTNITDNRTIFA